MRKTLAPFSFASCWLCPALVVCLGVPVVAADGGVSPPCPSYDPADHKVVLLGLTDDRELWSAEFRQSLGNACEMAKAIQYAGASSASRPMPRQRRKSARR